MYNSQKWSLYENNNVTPFHRHDVLFVITQCLVYKDKFIVDSWRK